MLACAINALPAESPAVKVAVLNLKNYGWEPPHRQNTLPSIAVDHEGRVIVGFTVWERTGLVTRIQPSLGFRIIRFMLDGNPDLSVSLPTNEGGRTDIYLSDNDQIIARANDSLQLLQENERNPKERAWKILASCTARCHVEQSPTRHTLLLYTEGSDPPLTFIRLSQQPQLQVCGKSNSLIKSNEDKIQNYPQSITDEFAYFHGWEPGAGAYAYRWPLCNYDKRVEMPLRLSGRWTVLNDNIFVANTYSNPTANEGIEVISPDGRVKFRPTLLMHESADSLWVPVKSSERADRIAVDVFTIRGRNQTLDISGHLTARRIAVYDIEAGKEIASIPVNTKHRFGFKFDLSPNGHRLAILEDDIARVVEVQ